MSLPYYNIINIPPDHIRTQKARGIRVVACSRATFEMEVPRTGIAQTKQQLKGALAHAAHGTSPIHHERLRELESYAAPVLWARPCPVRPRHGFVESRAVTTFEQVESVWHEMKKADKNGELLLQPMIEASASAILTPTMLAVGSGNAGATAGKDAWSLRLTPGRWARYVSDYLIRKEDGLPDMVLTSAGITHDEAPYAEVVYNSRVEKWDTIPHLRPILVQLRGGPRTDGSPDYIPRMMKVQAVRTIGENESLEAWEVEAKQLPKGTVVYHSGGVPCSHFGVHCVLNSIPYITTFEPHVGETLEQTCEDDSVQAEAFRAGVLMGLNTEQLPELAPSGESFPALADYLAMSLFSMHNIVADRSPLGSYLAGIGVAHLWRLLTCACLGELRHRKDKGGVSPMWAWDAERVTPLKQKKYRHKVFEAAWYMHPTELVPKLEFAAWSFLQEGWPASHGGLPWGQCAYAALTLYDAIQHVVRFPSARAVRVTMQRFNKTVNLAHNGGWVFNKFVGNRAMMDEAASMYRTFVLKDVVPTLVKLQNVRWCGTYSIKHKPRAWHTNVSAELRHYATSPDSIKRCDHASGSAAMRALEAEAQLEKEADIAATNHLAWASQNIWYWQFKSVPPVAKSPGTAPPHPTVLQVTPRKRQDGEPYLHVQAQFEGITSGGYRAWDVAPIDTAHATSGKAFWERAQHILHGEAVNAHWAIVTSLANSPTRYLRCATAQPSVCLSSDAGDGTRLVSLHLGISSDGTSAQLVFKLTNKEVYGNE